jgi:hypothetical protein
LAIVAAASSHAVSRLHDPATNHETAISGATNGNGENRGAWVAQVAAAKGEFLYAVAHATDGLGGSPVVTAISGDGKVYFGYPHSGNTTDICIKVPVGGWITFIVDNDSETERLFSFAYNRASCAPLAPPH